MPVVTAARKRWPLLLSLVLIANVVLAAGPGAGGAYACSCAGGSSSSEEALRRSDAVFSGEVVKLGELPPVPPGTTTMTMPYLDPVTFDVKGSWKGVTGESVVVHGQGPSASCGLDFERGETYLVFAGRAGGDGALQTDYCGHTFAASEETARNILGPPPETLPETGGVAPERAEKRAAPAYLAPTAAFVLVGLLLVRRASRGR